jgi:hypothetical protein
LPVEASSSIKEQLVTTDVQVHETTVSIVAPPLDTFPGGCDIALRVSVSCPSHCDLQGGKVAITGPEGAATKDTGLVSFDGAASSTDVLIVKAPTEPGEYTWTAVFAAREKEGTLHGESSASFSLAITHHATSLAVWDVPLPIVINTRFTVKVGARCSAECSLAGKELAIYDQSGERLATAVLGDDCWSDTGALYWTDVELEAPGAVGYHVLEARLPKPAMEFPHEGASYTFSFLAAAPPEHAVTIEVVDKDTNAPIEDADVVLHPYRSKTDESGTARLMAPKGEYGLYVAGVGKQIFQTAVKVTGDVAVRAELLAAPVRDESG